MQYNIKILKDTPFDKAYTVLSLEEFRNRYSYLINTHSSDEFLVEYIKGRYKRDHLDIKLSDWFEVAELRDTFKLGDWAWHEDLKRAFQVTPHSTTKYFFPNHCSFEAVNLYTKTYIRKASPSEIVYDSLTEFCHGKVLIGQYKCYYFNDVWRELIGIHKHITKYAQSIKEYTEISALIQGCSDIDASWSCNPNGLKVGCMEISHEDVLRMGRILKLIP